MKWGWGESNKPVIAFRGRWDNQKGVKLLTEKLLDLARVVLVTWGTPGEEKELMDQWINLQRWAKDHPQDLIVNPSEVRGVESTDMHYGLADFFLMPSLYEPCGLTQMECQRFGTLPIVRATGGLADTVSEKKSPTSPNGFLFQDKTPEALLDGVKRAVALFQKKDALRAYIRNALLQRNTWETRIDQYESLYKG
jgi:starch synthase